MKKLVLLFLLLAAPAQAELLSNLIPAPTTDAEDVAVADTEENFTGEDVETVLAEIADTISGLGGGHDAVTLGTFADLFLSLTSQQLDLELTDPGADRAIIWDDDPGAFAWLDYSGFVTGTPWTSEGYLTEEEDPDFAAWLLTGPLDDFLTEETDPSFVDWSVSQAPAVIHADNYTDTNTTYSAGTGMGLEGTTFNCTITQYTDSDAVTAIKADEDWNASAWDALVSFNWDYDYADLINTPTIPSGNEIIDWTTDQGATDIHSGNYTDTTLTDEQVQDKVGAMVSSNTETGVSVTYQDDDGTIDFEVGTLNQDTTGSAGSLKSPATTGLTTITGPAAGETRAKTVRDANDTLLELGGTYTPTGTWTWTSATATWPTFNQNTSGTAAGLSSTLAVASGGTGQTTAQAAIDALTAVSAATNEHVLTKDTVTGNAVWKAAAGGSGDVATDTIWDAAGDLAIGTGANTAAKVSIGAEEVVARIGAANIDGISMAEQTVLGRLTGGSIDDVAIGIADNNIVQMDSADAADDEYARFTANGLESRSKSEVAADLKDQFPQAITDNHVLTVDSADAATGEYAKFTANGIESKSIAEVQTDLGISGYKTIYIDAGAMVPATTNPAETGTKEYGTNDLDADYFAFDTGATEERVSFKIVMPEDYDLGTVKAKFYWSSATGSSTSDTVEWGISAVAIDNDGAMDVAKGTAVTVSDALLADNGADLQISAATGAMTIGGTPAAGKLVVFEVYRNTDGTDNMTEDAWLFGVVIQYQRTTTAMAGW
jgi:hypothetical protein